LRGNTLLHRMSQDQAEGEADEDREGSGLPSEAKTYYIEVQRTTVWLLSW